MNDSRVVLITGVSVVTGFETAVKNGLHGYPVALNGLNPEHGTLAVKKKLADQGIAARLFQGDVTSETFVKDIVAGVDEACGKIDVLVNNAGGLGGGSPIADMGTDFWDKVMNLNLKSTFLFVRECIPLLKRGQSASIIKNTSIAAYTDGGPGAAALIRYTRSCAWTRFGSRSVMKNRPIAKQSIWPSA